MGEAAILALGTAVPDHRIEQADVGRWLAEAFPGDPVLGRWVARVCSRSGIETRYTCIPGLLRDPDFSPGRAASEVPGTAARMAIYREAAANLGRTAARRALEGRRPTEVTHVIAISCTGFFAPGLDLALTEQLGLSSSVRRTVVGFMGCAGVFNGLRLAAEVVAGAPSARVLVVSVELSTLHIQPGPNREGLIAATLFGDGAGACLVGHPHRGEQSLFTLGAFQSRITPGTFREMVWSIGDRGFHLGLSPQVPSHLAAKVPGYLRESGVATPRFWAIHPGGRAVLDRLGTALGLTGDDLAPSRAVLRQYGNMSSATILFVLDEVRRRLSGLGSGPTEGVAMAFGPGLVTEMVRLGCESAAAGTNPGEALAHVGD